MRPACIKWTTVLGMLLMSPLETRADPIAFTFAKVVDTNTPVPGGTGNFTEFAGGFSVGPALSGGTVAFTAAGSSGQMGVYKTNIGGVLETVADTNTPIPGGTGNLGGFRATANSNGTIAVRAVPTATDMLIFTDIGGHLNVVVNTNTPVPGGTGNFSSLSLFYSFDGQNVAFCGADALGLLGVYTDVGGRLNVVANTNTPIPGGIGNFTTFNLFDEISNGNTAFLGFGSSGQTGIYTDLGGRLNVVADTNTPIPGGTGNFTGFGSFSFSDGNLTFLGFGSSGQMGYYTNIGGALRVVADTNTPIPEGIGNFTEFGFSIGPSLSGENIAFAGLGPFGQAGLYMEIGGVLTKVINNGETLDGKSFSSFAPFISPMALDGRQVAFHILFNDLSQGIFVATSVPEPSALVLMSTGILVLIGYGLRRKRQRV